MLASPTDPWATCHHVPAHPCTWSHLAAGAERQCVDGQRVAPQHGGVGPLAARVGAPQADVAGLGCGARGV